jgi:hypothetical protein
VPYAWPPLPTDPSLADTLIQARTKRLPGTRDNTSPLLASVEKVRALLREQLHKGQVVSGWRPIMVHLRQQMDQAAATRRGSFLLWGTYHDAGEQVETFQRLIGPLGLGKLTAVAAEPFTADGYWRDVPSALQRGSSGAMAHYLRSGDPQALEQIWNLQQEGNYTAWKYRYLPTVMSLLVTSRATGQQLLGCDMPPPLQGRLSSLKPPQVDQLRELHCMLALKDAVQHIPPPHHVAMLWGQSHITRRGIQRFLPQEARVLALYVHGHRPGEVGLEVALGQVLALTDPLLIPIPGHDDEVKEYLMLLLGPRLLAKLNRARDTQERPLRPAQRHQLDVQSSVAGEFSLTGWPMPLALVPDQTHTVFLSPGESTTFLFSGKGLSIAGTLTMPAGGALKLHLAPDRRAVQLTLYRPSKPTGAPARGGGP